MSTCLPFPLNNNSLIFIPKGNDSSLLRTKNSFPFKSSFCSTGWSSKFSFCLFSA